MCSVSRNPYSALSQQKFTGARPFALHVVVGSCIPTMQNYRKKARKPSFLVAERFKSVSSAFFSVSNPCRFGCRLHFLFLLVPAGKLLGAA